MGNRASAPVAIVGDTIVDAFSQNVRHFADRASLRWHSRGVWLTMTWSEYGRAVAQVAAGLDELGISPQSQIAILSGNRMEWHVADFGVLSREE